MSVAWTGHICRTEAEKASSSSVFCAYNAQCWCEDWRVESSTLYVSQWKSRGTSLVIQWQRIHLPMQGTLVPSPGKIPCAAGQLSPCTTTAEPVLHRKRSHRSENPSTATIEQPCSPKLKKACAAMKTEHSQKKKNVQGMSLWGEIKSLKTDRAWTEELKRLVDVVKIDTVVMVNICG